MIGRGGGARGGGQFAGVASHGCEGVDGRSVLDLEWHFVPLQLCGFTSIDPLTPVHGNAVNRAGGGPGSVEVGWGGGMGQSGTGWPKLATRCPTRWRRYPPQMRWTGLWECVRG